MLFTNTHKSCDSFSLNTVSNKYSFLFSNTVICTAIHGEGEKVNFRQKNENYLTNHMSKFVGFGCDGASNMIACKTGLVTRLQECYPEVIEK
jgi:hypothetical protein